MRFLLPSVLICCGLMPSIAAAAVVDLPLVEEGAPEAAKDPVVATVNGEPLSLRDLENVLLAQEGREAVMKLVDAELGRMDWDGKQDNDTIVSMGQWKLSRRVLSAQLLRSSGGTVRDEMINILVVEQALRKEGIVIGELLLDAEYNRHKTAFAKKLIEINQPQIPFAQYVMQTQGLDPAGYKETPGFRMLAGIHALVLKRAEVSEVQLQDFHRDNRGLFTRPAQVRMQALALEFETTEGIDGRPVVNPDHKQQLRLVSASLYKDIRDKRGFEEVWKTWGKFRDPQAGAGGDIGWVGPNGKRQQIGAKRLPKAVMDQALRADISKGPVLLGPIEHPEGIVIARVNDKREGVDPAFADIKPAVRRAYLEANMSEYSSKILGDIRRNAKIEYESMGAIIHQKAKDIGIE